MKIKNIDITAETERLSALAAVMLEKARSEAGLKKTLTPGAES